MSDTTAPIIGCIVEGEGDEIALPVLIRRIAAEIDPSAYVEVVIGKRTPRSALVRAGGIEQAVDATARVLTPRGAVLILLDADDDCPATLGPDLLQRAQAAHPDRLISVVLAKREYEAWFLAAATSLRGKRGLPDDLKPPSEPENVRGAKEWLRARLPRGQRYKETARQPAFTALFDLQRARGADSFDKCYREIAPLIAALTPPGTDPADPAPP